MLSHVKKIIKDLLVITTPVNSLEVGEPLSFLVKT